MDTPIDLPSRLWKANLDLQLRIGELLRDSSSEWLGLGVHAVGEGAEECDVELRDVLRSGNWQAMAALPVDAFWRQVQQRIGDGQALAQVAVNAQNTFASGLIEALQAWQKATTEALAGAGRAKDADAALRAMFGPWLAFQSAFVPPAGKGSKPRGG